MAQPNSSDITLNEVKAAMSLKKITDWPAMDPDMFRSGHIFFTQIARLIRYSPIQLLLDGRDIEFRWFAEVDKHVTDAVAKDCLRKQVHTSLAFNLVTH